MTALPRGMKEYFLLSSVNMANDHIINQLSGDQLNGELNRLFMKGLLGQYKLKEDIVGGADDRTDDRTIDDYETVIGMLDEMNFYDN